MKKLLALILCLCMVFALVACNKTDEGTEGEGGEGGGDTTGPLKIACLINGTLGDLSFFDSANNGMVMLKDELGDAVDISVIEMSYDNTKWEPALIDAAESDYDIIIVGTWQMQEILEKYNELQRAQGLNLKKYQGKSAMKYTYLLEEYPGYEGRVLFTMLVYKDKVIAGDVCGIDEAQFIHGFERKTPRDTSDGGTAESSAAAE